MSPASSCSSWPDCQPAYHIETAPFPSRDWHQFVAEHDQSWRNALISGGVPLLLKGSPSSSWRARSDWRHEDGRHWTLHHESGVLGNCHTSTQRTFRYFDVDRPLESTLSAASAYASVNQSEGKPMTVSSFFGAAFAGHYRYCSVGLESVGSRLLQDLGQVGELAVDPPRTFGNVWLGDGGTSAHPHYDTEHNMFSMVVGSKTFHLWDPRETSRLNLHPSQHAGGRQSQAEFSGGDPGRWPQVRASTAMSVELLPGDTLYLPPYWMHRVLSSGDALTIGVNAWSESEAFRVLGLAQRVPLPVAASLSTADRIRRVVRYLSAIAEALPRALGPNAIADLVHWRYTVDPLRATLLAHGTLRIEASECATPPAVSGVIDHAAIEEAARVVERAAKVAELLSAVPGGDGVAAILFGDYVELVSSAAFGAHNVARFLVACFTSPS